MRGMIDTLRWWSPRRWITVSLSAPLLTWVILAAGQGHRWWGWLSALMIAMLAAVVLASYLPTPGSGRLVDVGCSPCAAVAGMAVLFAVLARVSAPGSAVTAVIAALVLVAAVRQRLTDAAVCATPPPSPSRDSVP